LNKYRMGIQ